MRMGLHSNSKAIVEERRAAWRVRLQSELARIVERLSTFPDIEKIILFGSTSRGSANLFSDIDLVVIQRTGLRFVDRIEEVQRRLQPRICTDILVYTPEEWVTMGRETTFGKRVTTEGKVLYAADAA